MPPTAFALVICAAFLHAGYNLAIKRAEDRNLFTWWAMMAGAVLFLPVYFLQAPLPSKVLPYALLSACLEVVYILVLVQAYRLGDFSLVYPVLRGAAPAFLALMTFIFLDERPDPAGWVGLGLLLAGLLVVSAGNVHAQWKAHTGPLSLTALGVALFGALLISIYSTVDGAAVHLASPSAYNILMLNLTWIFASPLMVIHYGPRRMYAVVCTNWRRILIVGFLMTFTYSLVLLAYSIGQVNYAGALRESSVVLAALAGWLWLGEEFGLLRTIGSLMIFGGVLVIGVLA